MHFNELDNKTALHIAMENRNIEIINILLADCNININAVYVTHINYYKIY